MYRIFFMLLGSVLTYYVSMKIIEQTAMIDGTFEKNDECLIKLEDNIGKSLNLTMHERTLLSSVTTTNKNIKLKDVIGHEELKKEVESMVLKPLQCKEFYKECDLLKPPNGIILYGPPGTGKTMIAKAISNEFSGCFINFSINQIENKLYGESLKMLKAVFTLADKIKPCVIFIDEIDGIFGKRNILDQTYVNSLKTMFLREMDGFIEKDPSILVIGTTNKLNNIDDAVLRRMRIQFYVGLPTDEDIEAMLSKLLYQFPKIDCKKLANELSGFSGSDIQELCKYSAHKSLIKSTSNTFEITSDTVLECIEHFRN